MKTLAIIPARCGSKGLPGKNTKMMCGKPLIEWTFIELAKSKMIKDVVVSTNDDEVVRLAAKYNLAIHYRQGHLCTDSAKLVDVLRDVVNYFSHEIIVEVLGTNPLHTASDMDAIVKKLIKTKADSVVGVCQAQEYHPQRLKWLKGDSLMEFEGQEEKPGLNRQDYRPIAYQRTAGIIAMTRDSLIQRGRGAGPKRLACVLPKERCVDIDTQADWVWAEYLMKRRIK